MEISLCIRIFMNLLNPETVGGAFPFFFLINQYTEKKLKAKLTCLIHRPEDFGILLKGGKGFLFENEMRL